MSYFKDNSQYIYFNQLKNRNVINIGWLDNKHSFEQERCHEQVLSLLWRYSLYSVNQTRGMHECELCGVNSSIVESRDGISLSLGSAELRVFSKTGEIFASPNLLYHYVVKHNYKLSQEFVEALRNNPPPNQLYFERLNEIGLEHSDTLRSNSKSKRFSLF